MKLIIKIIIKMTKLEVKQFIIIEVLFIKKFIIIIKIKINYNNKINYYWNQIKILQTTLTFQLIRINKKIKINSKIKLIIITKLNNKII